MAENGGVSVLVDVVVCQNTAVIKWLSIPDEEHIFACHDKGRKFTIFVGQVRQSLFDCVDVFQVRIDHHAESLQGRRNTRRGEDHEPSQPQ